MTLSLQVLCNRMSLNERQLKWVCYGVVLLLLVKVLVFSIDNNPQDAFQGVWGTVFFVYLIYAFLPIRMRMAVISGVLLSVAQTVCAVALNYSDPYIARQVPLHKYTLHQQKRNRTCSFRGQFNFILSKHEQC